MTIRPLRPSEATDAAALAARAFFDDPLFVHIYPDPSRRLAGFTREHDAYIRSIYLPAGTAEIAVDGGRLQGLALWLPPGTSSPWWREILLLPRLARAMGLRRLLPNLRDYRAFDHVWPSGSFWYLGLLAVDPSAQGQGVGSALLRAGIERANAEGVGTFLETGTQKNVAFYRRHGFQVTQDVVLPHGPLHWALWRDPSASSQ
ncbi:MAG: GNAT family N-acetyltransferase [Bacteroidota bacterium]